jgi:hypothetical protein
VQFYFVSEFLHICGLKRRKPGRVRFPGLWGMLRRGDRPKSQMKYPAALRFAQGNSTYFFFPN